jgi:PAS domain S-box-containing protein
MKNEHQKLLQEIKKTEARLLEMKVQSQQFELKAVDSASVSFLNELELNEFKVGLNEELIQNSEDFSNQGRWKYIFETNVMEWSEEAYKIFEYPENYKGSLNEFYLECIDERTTNLLPTQVEKLKTSYNDVMINHTIHTPNGNTKNLSCVSTPILDKKGDIIGVEGYIKDLTSHITGNKGLDNFFNLSHDLHCIVHMDHHFVKVSPSWSKLLGYSEKELISNSFLDFVHPDDVEKSAVVYDKLEDAELMSTFENRYLTKSGEIVYLSWNSQIDEETNLAYCTARDITETKLVKDSLLNDLSEKELLLREIHHRVKNNLQIISSLLSLQAGANSEHEQLTELYDDSKNRIQSMAAIHEMFYQSDELDKIEFCTYTKKLVGDLSKAFASKNKIIDFSFDAVKVFLNLDTAIPLGLLINEMVTNSIKHGEDEFGNVNIFVVIKKSEEGLVEFTIGDKGINTQKDILNNEGNSLGVLLINSLVEQIDGEIEQLNSDVGTTFKLFFKNRPSISP